jgi:hypothetical protein
VCSLSTGVEGKVDRNEQAGRRTKCEQIAPLVFVKHRTAVVIGTAPYVVPGRISSLLDSLCFIKTIGA